MYVLLTQVLWRESIGLLPLGNNLFNFCFTHWPLVGFDAGGDELVTLSNPGWPKNKIHPE
jgi:hypothetical protein